MEIPKELESFVIIRERKNNAISFTILTSDYLAFDKMFDSYPAKLSAIAQVTNGKWQIAILATKEDIKNFQKKTLEKIIENKEFIENLRNKSRKIAEQLLQLCKSEIKTENVEKASNEKLGELYLRIVNLYNDFCYYNIPLWFVAVDELGEFIEEKLTEIVGKEKASKIFNILTTSTEPSWTFREEMEEHKIAFEIEKKGQKELFIEEKEIEKKFPEIYKKIGQLAKDFGQIPFDYTGPKIWGENYFVEKIRKILKKGNVEEKLEELENYHKKIKNEQLKIAEKYNLPEEIVRISREVQKITAMQDEKKEWLTKVHVYIQNTLIPEISKRTGLSSSVLNKVYKEEMKEILEGKIKKDEIKKRENNCAFVFVGNKFNIYAEKEARELWEYFYKRGIKKVKEIKGTVAARGYAKGRVKIVLHSSEIGKVEKGDILVTTMTTPDFVPAMRKVAAIVTDEGGITCHAAIVSRELGIPCVIGTSVATKALKDGDEIEVDAERGIVKIIKKEGEITAGNFQL